MVCCGVLCWALRPSCRCNHLSFRTTYTYTYTYTLSRSGVTSGPRKVAIRNSALVGETVGVPALAGDDFWGLGEAWAGAEAGAGGAEGASVGHRGQRRVLRMLVSSAGAERLASVASTPALVRPARVPDEGGEVVALAATAVSSPLVKGVHAVGSISDGHTLPSPRGDPWKSNAEVLEAFDTLEVLETSDFFSDTSDTLDGKGHRLVPAPVPRSGGEDRAIEAVLWVGLGVG